MSGYCKHCGRPLKDSQYTHDGKWKSCPKCSVEHGEEHIFYSYPSGFGESIKRATESKPDGPQSYCYPCRVKNYGPHPGAKRCSEVN